MGGKKTKGEKVVGVLADQINICEPHHTKTDARVVFVIPKVVQSVYIVGPYTNSKRNGFLTVNFLLVQQTTYYHAYLWESPCGGLFSLAICVGFSPYEALDD